MFVIMGLADMPTWLWITNEVLTSGIIAAISFNEIIYLMFNKAGGPTIKVFDFRCWFLEIIDQVISYHVSP